MQGDIELGAYVKNISSPLKALTVLYITLFLLAFKCIHWVFRSAKDKLMKQQAHGHVQERHVNEMYNRMQHVSYKKKPTNSTL